MAHDPLTHAGSPALDETQRAAAPEHAHAEPESSGSDNDTDDGHRRNIRASSREELRATPVPCPVDAMLSSSAREEGESRCHTRAALALNPVCREMDGWMDGWMDRSNRNVDG